MSEDQRCGNCRFFLEADPDPSSGFGYCRRYPPVYVSALVAKAIKDDVADAENYQELIDNATIDGCIYPRQEPAGWCGEWQAAEPEA